MNLRFLKFLLTGLYAVSANAQIDWYKYDWSTQKCNENDLVYNYSYEYCLNTYRNNIYIGGLNKKFSLESACDIYDDYNYGKIYNYLIPQEKYIKKVINSIVNDTSITNKIRVCFYRSEEFSASMYAAGFLMLNIGILSRLDNEAELALLLGHEITHFVNKDAIKNYGKTLELKYMDRGYSVWGILSQYSRIKNYYSFSKDQESEADQASINLLRNSPYSLESASTILRKLKRIEIRNEIKNLKKEKPFTTHPNPGERLNAIKKLVTSASEKQKRNFFVDSVSFVQLKELCFQETVNMGLLNTNYDDLITLCFSRYLLQPSDGNNLAVLIECLRRKLFIEKALGVADKSFILGEYQTPAINTSENYAFLRERRPSILKHLDKGFVDIWKEDFDQIKALDLIDGNHIEFTSNLEAYVYFKDVAKKANQRISQHYNYFGKQANFSDVESYCAINSVFATNDYLKEKGILNASKKDLIVIIPPTAFNVADVMGENELQTYLKRNNLLLQSIKSKLTGNVMMLSDLNCNDIHLIASLIKHANFYLSLKPPVYLNQQFADWTEFCPELYSFFKMNDIQNLFVYDLNLTTARTFTSDFYRISIPKPKNKSFIKSQNISTVVENKLAIQEPKKISDEIYKFYKRHAH